MALAHTPFTLSGLSLPHRIVMAPMTRSRSGADGTVSALDAAYFRQRASAALIITGGIQINQVAEGYPGTPGIYRPDQVDSWREVTEAAHQAGGRIFAQLSHNGRIGHPLNNGGLTPVAPSAVRATRTITTLQGPQEIPTPRELSSSEVEQVIKDFVQAARNAVDAGFDGVEIHGGNGYLLHQFLSTNVNQRTDEWGGSVSGRIRLAEEVVRQVAAEIGPDRVGIRLAPGNSFNDVDEPDAAELYTALVTALNGMGIAYLHLVEGPDGRPLTEMIRQLFTGALILNPYSGARPTGIEELALLDEGLADLIAFATHFIANPDLPRRLKDGVPLASPDFQTVQGGGAEGYIDYPAAQQALYS